MTHSDMSQQTRNAQARARAQAAVEGLAAKATSLVKYRSNGHLAVIGGEEAQQIALRLRDKHKVSVVLLYDSGETGSNIIPAGGRRITVSGHLGAFNIAIGKEGTPGYETFAVDQVLDLSPDPLCNAPLQPPGYIHCTTEEDSILEATAQLDSLVGTFEKPRYFAYDASICAHGRAGHAACNRCVAACPAEAITGLAERIEVDPYLCQGGGVCTAVCPSGAIRYNYPAASDMLDRIRTLLRTYRAAEGEEPVVAFIAEHDAEALDPVPSNVLPVVVEEVASIGPDIWLSTLAFGAQRVLLVEGNPLVARVRNALMMQLFSVQEILCGLGYPDDAVSLVRSDELNDACESVMPVIVAATFAGLSEKRRMTFMAIDHLYAQSPAAMNLIPLSPGAAFGHIVVDKSACTLCLSCTSVCPTHAVEAGNDLPALLFSETQCVQCGICASACPERAITLEPRLLADPELRQRQMTLHEEEALCCINCGKPFATQSVINAMLSRLEGHWMFQNERAKRRLLMCEDCRVIDIAQDPDAMAQGFTAPHRQ